MKSIIKKSIPFLAVLLLPLTACEDEPEVGSTLYPVEPENFDAKLYINETALPGNQATLEVIQTPVSLITPDDEISFNVKLTKPVANDVTVTVAENADLAAAYGNGAEALPAGTLKIENATVTVKAGSTVSAESVKLKLIESDAVKNLASKGVAAVAIASNNAGIATGSNNNAYYVVLNKKVTNYKGQLADEIATMTQIPGTSITATVDGYSAAELTDGSLSTEFWYWYAGGYDVVFEFEKTTSVRGLGFYSNSYTGYCPNIIEILTSNDGETWTSQTGGQVALSRPSSNQVLIPFVLYAVIPCNYVKLKFYSCFWTSYGSDYDWPAASEVNLYN
ncbi:MAG: BT_3987 domain-containing protein [Muribaculaceae bacterium]